MDILKTPGLGLKIVVSIAAILGLGLAVIALQVKPEAKPSTAPRTSPVTPAPSKDNVSKLVEERIVHLKAVVSKNPSDARSAIELARTLQDGHDLPGALKYYEMGLKTDPGRLEARIDYSLCLYQSGRESDAFEQTEMVLRQDAANAHALYNLGAIYANRGQSDSAVYYWKYLISAHPGDELSKKATENLKKLTVGGAPAM